jgi:hypothetical protein
MMTGGLVPDSRPFSHGRFSCRDQAVAILLLEGLVDVVEVEPVAFPSGLAGLFVPGPVDQNAAHCLSGCREEVSPMVPAINISGADQAQIGLMYQSRRLERLPHLLVG